MSILFILSKVAELYKFVKNIKLVIIDVDGVLTDGAIYIDSEGREIKAFHVLDGTGAAYLHSAGIKIAIISGKDLQGGNPSRK